LPIKKKKTRIKTTHLRKWSKGGREAPWFRAGGRWWSRAWRPGRRISWLRDACPASRGRSWCCPPPSCGRSLWSAGSAGAATPPRWDPRGENNYHFQRRTMRKKKKKRDPWMLLPGWSSYTLTLLLPWQVVELLRDGSHRFGSLGNIRRRWMDKKSEGWGEIFWNISIWIK